MHAELLTWVPRVFIVIALAAWALTLFGLIHQLVVQSKSRQP
jgi:hypothetical protein